MVPSLQASSAVIDELDSEVGKLITVGRLDTDENPETSKEFSIMSIPTLMLLKDGKKVKQLTGFHNKGELIACWENILTSKKHLFRKEFSND